MLMINNPVPCLDRMPIYYKNVSKSYREMDTITVILRCDDTYYNPKKPTKENIISDYKCPFGDSIFLGNLRHISSWAVVDEGVFYVKYKKGLFYFHRSGAAYKIFDNENISEVSFENGIVKVYSVTDLIQTEYNQHYDTYMGLSEEWRDSYKVKKQEIKQFTYSTILEKINAKEDAIWTEKTGLSSMKALTLKSMYAFVDKERECLTGCEAQASTELLNVLPLYYKNNIMGYRFTTDKGEFDMNFEAATKYGLDKMDVSKAEKIELYRAYSILVEKNEPLDWSMGKTYIYDISSDEACCKKMAELL